MISTQALRELAERATPGPWKRVNYDVQTMSDVHLMHAVSCRGRKPDENSAFVAAANPSTILAMLDAIEAAKKTVDEQANDDGLWFIAKTATEAYLQQELRRLHEVIEKALSKLEAT